MQATALEDARRAEPSHVLLPSWIGWVQAVFGSEAEVEAEPARLLAVLTPAELAFLSPPAFARALTDSLPPEVARVFQGESARKALESCGFTVQVSMGVGAQ
jgi:hypothetical protein